MAISAPMRRLLQLRKTEEQNQRLLLSSMMVELDQLEAALEEAYSRERSGRELLCKSVWQESVQDRYIGMLEVLRGSNRAHCARMRIELTKAKAAELRAELLKKHREKEQIQILIRNQSEREHRDSLRRLQLQLDDWARSTLSAPKQQVQFSSDRLHGPDCIVDEMSAFNADDF